jgi:hypothetical protein
VQVCVEVRVQPCADARHERHQRTEGPH